MDEKLNTSQWRKQSVGDNVRVDWTGETKWDTACATYDASGRRTWTSEGKYAPTDAHLAAWDAEAPLRVKRILVAKRADVAKREAAARGIDAKFSGTCAMSGERYNKGARIEHTMYGWSLVGAKLDVFYNMTREDSPL